MFVDEVRVRARAGRGGRGCVAFLREAYRPKGGPSGGNGGNGGHVILEADHDLNNLIAQYYQPHLTAEHGEHGMGKGMDGRAGKDLVVKVPCGTLVWRLPSPPTESRLPPATPADSTAPEEGLRPAEAFASPRILDGPAGRAIEIDLEAAEPRVSSDQNEPQKGELVADLVEHRQRFVLCRGGRGGLGNRNFATARRQAPRFAQPGEPGESGEFRLELRLIADVGLVGFPNAGKSTLLTAISKARPRIAPYPFTTLTPKIGIVEYPDWARLKVCDIPGLIEGAHRNLGLGHAFLRHIARCKVIVLVIDMAGTDGRQPWDDCRQLLKELELHDPDLLNRPRLVVANKMDEPAAGPNLRSFKRRIPRTEVLRMAAAFDEGIDEFKNRIRAAVQDASH
ncbi:MAG: GTPase ObgE [Verrucomicrobia bacterium]|nr:GTPase ObgE [Verrucomicrobiota bacterium]OQC65660.1 MAG: GTPase ObgE [Verrucomicrobia bacterium ADurb.Bin006]MDI9379383.1 GTPase ObgE [Verrucomicrobiota bacterium]HOA60427.1 GTPase ObgE [Verrucomicrobiota bacterium]HOG88745.1 GTPase ObgE [Verrucomicrobiota bacterium]